MSEDDAGHDSFEETVRSIMREVSQSVERVRGELDGVADAFGVDATRAKDWVDKVGGWLGSQAENLDAEALFRNTWPTGVAPDDTTADRPGRPADNRPADDQPAAHEDPLRGAGPHPLDVPTGEQGPALAALHSGRWSVEPGTNALVSHGEGPGPSDALGLVRELRARDWITAEGEVTLVGRHALSRWLESDPAR
jgi:hypothetical protein